jgi:protein-tyrosine phosphatase
MSEIIQNKLYLGNIYDANDIQFIKDNNITTIITTANKCSLNDEILQFVKHHQFLIEDKHTFNIAKFFNEICDIIENEINNNGCVLVHCWSGISRSVCCTIAYLMKYKEKSYLEAWRMIYYQRDIINMNDGFVEQLAELELELYGINSV